MIGGLLFAVFVVLALWVCLWTLVSERGQIPSPFTIRDAEDSHRAYQGKWPLSGAAAKPHGDG